MIFNIKCLLKAFILIYPEPHGPDNEFDVKEKSPVAYDPMSIKANLTVLSKCSD